MRSTTSSTTNRIGRSYRSHSRPACGPCRKRKSRCSVAARSSTCVTCQIHGTPCDFERYASPPRAATRSYGQSLRNSRTAEASSILLGDEIISNGTAPDARVIFSGSGEQTTHVVSPAMIEDNNVLARYLSNLPAEEQPLSDADPADGTVPQHTKPVLFLSLTTRSTGTTVMQTLAHNNCQVIQKILDPEIEDMIDIFFANMNPCFPILEERSFREVYETQKKRISPALLANLYANAFAYWSVSHTDRVRHDQQFIWMQANEALHAELYTAPGIATVLGVILNLCGRPSTSLFGNGGLMGTAIALSFALGLNRDPTSWTISAAEKSLRIRIWWLIVTLNYWCSLAHGVPSFIQRAHQDVPFPCENDLCLPGSSAQQHVATRVFLAFLSLTQVLGRYLDDIYHVAKGEPVTASSTTVELETALIDWEDSLDDEVRRLAIRGPKLGAPGAANLRLAYLTVKFVLRRRQCELATRLPQHEFGSTEKTASSYEIDAQRVAEEIIHHIQELDEFDLRDFWMPMVRCILTFTTTFLLRTAVRTNESGNNRALRLARDMMDCLQSHRALSSWDIADDCISRCSAIIDRLESDSQGHLTVDAAAPGFSFTEELLNESRLFSDVAFPDLWSFMGDQQILDGQI